MLYHPGPIPHWITYKVWVNKGTLDWRSLHCLAYASWVKAINACKGRANCTMRWAALLSNLHENECFGSVWFKFDTYSCVLWSTCGYQHTNCTVMWHVAMLWPFLSHSQFAFLTRKMNGWYRFCTSCLSVADLSVAVSNLENFLWGNSSFLLQCRESEPTCFRCCNL